MTPTPSPWSGRTLAPFLVAAFVPLAAQETIIEQDKVAVIEESGRCGSRSTTVG
jgi:hypothetical protein